MQNVKYIYIYNLFLHLNKKKISNNSYVSRNFFVNCFSRNKTVYKMLNKKYNLFLLLNEKTFLIIVMFQKNFLLIVSPEIKPYAKCKKKQSVILQINNENRHVY